MTNNSAEVIFGKIWEEVKWIKKTNKKKNTKTKAQSKKQKSRANNTK